jgi:hypothetical protein
MKARSTSISNLSANQRNCLICLLLCAIVFATNYAKVALAQQAGLSLHLSFEAQNYAPPEYLARARTLPIAGTPLFITAGLVSRGAGGAITLASPSQYIFRWFLNGVMIAEEVGQNELRYTVPAFSAPSPLIFRAEAVRAATRATAATSELRIEVANPIVYLREVTPGGGPNVSANTRFTGAQNASLSVEAIPDFFNVQTLNQLIFRWFSGENAIGGAATIPNLVTFRLPDAAGSQNFSLRVENSVNPVEQTVTNFFIETR